MIDLVCLPKIGTFFDAFLSYINRFPFFVPTASFKIFNLII